MEETIWDVYARLLDDDDKPSSKKNSSSVREEEKEKEKPLNKKRYIISKDGELVPVASSKEEMVSINIYADINAGLLDQAILWLANFYIRHVNDDITEFFGSSQESVGYCLSSLIAIQRWLRGYHGDEIWQEMEDIAMPMYIDIIKKDDGKYVVKHY